MRKLLSTIAKKIPLTGVEWGDKYFRLPEGSSQIAGQWTTQPLQIVPLNMMTNDAIKLIAVKKSARLGYTKMLVAAMLYLAQHKKRSAVVYQPIDAEAEAFVVDEVDSVIAEMPIIQNVFPEWQSKNEKNKLTKKVMLGAILDFRGATAAGNFRRLTKQVVIGDEVNAWPLNVGRGEGDEGNPISLALQRLKGASFPKAIFGTTPTVTGRSHISNILETCDLTFRFYLPCPHCGTEQLLQFGERDGEVKDYGLLWDDSLDTKEKKAKSAYYKCCNAECGEHFRYADLPKMELAGRWIAEDLTWTKDGIHFYTDDNIRRAAPKKIGICINALYSLNLDGWSEIVAEWLSSKGRKEDERVFINTVLGEDYEEDQSEKLDHQVLFDRREVYDADVPDPVVHITAGIDSQRNRYECYVWGWADNDESYLIDKIVITGEYDSEKTLAQMDEIIRSRAYKKKNGTELPVSRYCWDTGGIDPNYVNERSKKLGLFKVVPIKGASTYGKPVATFPATRNTNGVYHTEIGTDTAKDTLYYRLLNTNPEQAGYIHLPLNDDICDEIVCQQLTSERLREKKINGKRVLRWDNEGRRNEALDCFVYAYAALRISIQKFGLNIKELSEKNKNTVATRQKIDIEAIGRGEY